MPAECGRVRAGPWLDKIDLSDCPNMCGRGLGLSHISLRQTAGFIPVTVYGLASSGRTTTILRSIEASSHLPLSRLFLLFSLLLILHTIYIPSALRQAPSQGASASASSSDLFPASVLRRLGQFVMAATTFNACVRNLVCAFPP